MKFESHLYLKRFSIYSHL